MSTKTRARPAARAITLAATAGTIGSLGDPVPVQVKTRRGPVEAVIMARAAFDRLLDHIEDLRVRGQGEGGAKDSVHLGLVV